MYIPERIAYLILRYMRYGLVSAESDELQTWVNSSDENRILFNELTETDIRNDQIRGFKEGKKNAWKKISRYIKTEKTVFRS
jgi:nicotinic acid mononucleotide adenylyltransferase